ncbi:vomeronasal type-2 receptor 26-like [Sminthopsis crassicaudata]|uniref:vomeronasal type-2 receptor 26-like n=1 Tax=Sminthopsis crassicaudata TaxID=9301 RepID=UPI003D69A5FF
MSESRREAKTARGQNAEEEFRSLPSAPQFVAGHLEDMGDAPLCTEPLPAPQTQERKGNGSDYEDADSSEDSDGWNPSSGDPRADGSHGDRSKAVYSVSHGEDRAGAAGELEEASKAKGKNGRCPLVAATLTGRIGCGDTAANYVRTTESWEESGTGKQDRKGEISVVPSSQPIARGATGGLAAGLTGPEGSKFCTGKEHLQGQTISSLTLNTLSETYGAYVAMYSIAHALQDLSSCNIREGPFGNGTCADIWDFQPWQAPHSVCSESCLPGSSQIPRQGWPHCCFDCRPCAKGYISKNRDMEQCEKCPEDQYSNSHRNHCVPKPEVFLSYEEPIGVAITCAALSFSLLTIFILGVFVRHRGSPLVRANNAVLSYILLMSLALCFLSSLLFLGHPTKVTCLLRQTTFGIVFTMAISSIFSKTITVVFAFQATRPGSIIRRWMRPRIYNSVVIIFSSIQVTICAIWLGTSPPFPAADIHSQPGYIIIECNEGSIIAFYCVLGYMGFLALGSFLVAFLAKNLPDTYNEAKFITFSMLVFCSVWISFLPTYHSTKGKAMVAVEIFSILASSAGLLGCIFVPKCYIILFRLNGHTHKLLKR